MHAACMSVVFNIIEYTMSCLRRAVHTYKQMCRFPPKNLTPDKTLHHYFSVPVPAYVSPFQILLLSVSYLFLPILQVSSLSLIRYSYCHIFIPTYFHFWYIWFPFPFIPSYRCPHCHFVYHKQGIVQDDPASLLLWWEGSAQLTQYSLLLNPKSKGESSRASLEGPPP